MSLTVTYSGFTFRGGAETSTGWFLNDEGLVGWSDGVDNRHQAAPRPNSHGSFGSTMLYREARVITVQGQYVGASVSEAKQARLAMAGVAASGQASAFMVADDELGLTLWSNASVVGAPKMPEQVIYPFFPFSFDLVASDPRRYGPLVSASTGLPSSGTGMSFPFDFPSEFGSAGDPGRLTITNVGTADSYPTLEVTGQVDSGFSIIDVATSREVRFERVVPVGSTVYLNSRTGRAYIDQVGSDVSGFLTRTDFPFIPAGGGLTLQFASLGSSSGGPMLTARGASAWW